MNNERTNDTNDTNERHESVNDESLILIRENARRDMYKNNMHMSERKRKYLNNEQAKRRATHTIIESEMTKDSHVVGLNVAIVETYASYNRAGFNAIVVVCNTSWKTFADLTMRGDVEYAKQTYNGAEYEIDNVFENDIAFEIDTNDLRTLSKIKSFKRVNDEMILGLLTQRVKSIASSLSDTCKYRAYKNMFQAIEELENGELQFRDTVVNYLGLDLNVENQLLSFIDSCQRIAFVYLEITSAISTIDAAFDDYEVIAVFESLENHLNDYVNENPHVY